MNRVAAICRWGLVVLVLALSGVPVTGQGTVVAGGGTATDGERSVVWTAGQPVAGETSAGGLRLLGGIRFQYLPVPMELDSSAIRLVVPTRMLLGAVAPGDTARQRLLVRNAGLISVDLGVTTDTSTFFAVPQTLSLDAGAEDSVLVHFVPGADGEARGALAIRVGGGAEVLAVQLAAHGGEPPESPVQVDFGIGPGDQGIRRAGNAATGKTFTAELHIVDAPPINGWSVTLELPQSLQFIAGSFLVSDFIPGIIALADANGSLVNLGGTALAGAAQASGSGQLGTFRLRVTDAFADSATFTVSEVTMNPLEGAPTPALVRATAVISNAPPVALRGDFSDDGKVDFDDFFAFADAFGTREQRFDLDGSGSVDFQDFFHFADLFGTSLGQD